jgi:cytochrome c biogenesis protein CcmG/thiol:disulfide interchange protein DsbE
VETDAAAPERRRRDWGVGRILVLVGVAAFVALLTYGVVSKAPDDSLDERLAEGKAPAAPGFDLPVLQRGDPGVRLDAVVERAAADGHVSLAELRGTPVVLNFWASWCPPCRTEAPLLERSWRRDRRRGVLLVGLDMQDLTADARGFIREFGNTYLNVRDRSDEVARDWGVLGLPETFFVSREGKVVGHVLGAVSAAQLRAGVAAARTGRPVGSRRGGERRSVR